MPKKKKSTSKIDELINFDTSKLLSGDKSYMSLIYGVVTVIVIFVIIFLGVRAISQRNVEVTEEAQTTEMENTYTVAEGENLWTIAEKVYNDGYKWTLIAEANKLDSPDAIETGMKLTIPEANETVAAEESSDSGETAMEVEAEPTAVPTTVPTEEPTTAPTKTPVVAASNEQKGVAGKAYTVAEGDSLWTIAEKTYNDGYKWVEIANANSIANPDLIYPGDKYNLPQ